MSTFQASEQHIQNFTVSRSQVATVQTTPATVSEIVIAYDINANLSAQGIIYPSVASADGEEAGDVVNSIDSQASSLLAFLQAVFGSGFPTTLLDGDSTTVSDQAKNALATLFQSSPGQNDALLGPNANVITYLDDAKIAAFLELQGISILFNEAQLREVLDAVVDAGHAQSQTNSFEFDIGDKLCSLISVTDGDNPSHVDYWRVCLEQS